MSRLEMSANHQQDLVSVQQYYCAKRAIGQTDMSIYEIWEHGGAFQDSVTPSCYSPDYRSHIVGKILSLTRPGATILSLGCGNGFVESDLARCHRVVTAIDCNDEAVLLTRQKGVSASRADFFALEPAMVEGIDLIYADGLVGHLFHPESGLRPCLDKLQSLHPKPGAHVVISNDSPREPGAAFAQHDRVKGFWFVSKEYLRDELVACGFAPTEAYYFDYRRPISGVRHRTIGVARAQ